jgi:hypothetical protein
MAVLKLLTHVKYRRSLFSVNDYFLTKDVRIDAAINYFIQVPENINGTLNEFYTLLIDLKQSSETIWDDIYYRTRAEITSFLTNQNFEYKLLTEISVDELKKFIDLFNLFAKHKNIRLAETERLKAFNTEKIFAVSYIKQNNELICINFYRLTKQRATNISSFHFKHKLEKNYSASHFGRAHRALHWLDIKEFKKMEVDTYDFCGWYNGSEDKELLNINKFKEQFTQYKVKEYSGVIYKNRFLALLKKLR